MKKWIVRIMVPLVLISVLTGCGKNADNIEKVNIYKMVSFNLTEKDSLITFSDSEVIETFRNAFNNAKRVPGIVDVANPEYKVELGNQTYFLWIRQDSGTIMNLNDSNHVYTLSKSSAGRIYELIK